MGETALSRRALIERGALLAGSTALLAACGTVVPAGAPAAKVRSGVTVTLMSAEDAQSNQDARNQQIANFKQQYPGITVERQRVANFPTKLVAAFAAGTPPDMYTTSRNDVTSQAPKGMALALD